MRKFLLFLFLLFPTMAFASDKDHPWGDAVNKVTDFAIQKMNSLIDATSKALPTVTKYAMQVVSMGCLIDLIYWVLFPIIGAVSINYFIKYIKLAWIGGECHETFIPYMLVTVLTGVVSLIAVLVTLVGLDLWKFVCVIHPDIYLIHLAVQKVLGG